MKLYFYLSKRFLRVFLMILGVFLLFMTLIDFVEQMRRYDSSVGYVQILELALLNTPFAIYRIMPLILIISAITLMLGLARSSELVAIRASGRSALAALMAPILTTAVLGVLAVAFFNPIVAATSTRYAELREVYGSDGRSILSIGPEGLWLRQGDRNGQTVIRADRANSDATVLYDVTMWSFSQKAGLKQRVEARSAELRNDTWHLSYATVWPFIPGIAPQSAIETHDRLKLTSTLTQAQIRDSFGQTHSISVWSLPSHIKNLESAGFAARRFHVWLQMELARPLFWVAMMMIGAGFTMRHSRFGGTGLAVLGAVLSGFLLYYIRNFAQILGENDQIPILMAAWAPPLASIMLAAGLILHMEDG